MKKLNVLLIGSGARENALAWLISQSPRLEKLYVAPGNAATSTLAENVEIPASEIRRLLGFARTRNIDLTIVGPEDPLAMGIVDIFMKNDQLIFGPTSAATEIESSKAFAKRLMFSMEIPTAPYETFTNHTDALEHMHEHFRNSGAKPIVIKASGLAVGKGVYVCRTLAEAQTALEDLMIRRVHKRAGDEIVVEEFVEGSEVSLHAISDGKSFISFPFAQDHKSVRDGDEGPNTGGMGAIAPVPGFDQYTVIDSEVLQPAFKGMSDTGRPFAGLLFPGLKISDQGAKVLEFNARFGDPETQVYMRLMKTNILDVFMACVEQRLHEMTIEWRSGFAACIVLASHGYPGDYQKGAVITGIEEAEKLDGVVVFQAGTILNPDGVLKTSGGRVLSVTATGATLQEALDQAYKAVACIHFEGMHFRTDIGAKTLAMQTASV